MNLRTTILIIVSIFCVVAQPVVYAQSRTNDSPTLRLHLKAEDLYQRGHFKRAYFIYVNELAAIGDKYSQYMAGYMCLNGQGMRRDPIRASAWYRLAAERGAPEFAEVRDNLLESMSDADRALSDEAYIELRRKYGDLALALEQVRLERRQLRAGTTGSRLTGGSSPVTVLDPRTGTAVTREDYVNRVEERMQIRLDLITSTLGIEPVEADMSDAEFEHLADQVAQFLGTIDDR